MFNYAERCSSFGVSGLLINEEQLTNAGEMNDDDIEDSSMFDLYQQTLADEVCLDDSNKMSSNWQVDVEAAGSTLEETSHDQANEDREKTVKWGNELMYGGVAGVIEDDIADRCAWHGGNHDFISSQTDSWLQQDRQPHQDYGLHNSSVVKAEMPKSEKQPGNESSTQGEWIVESKYQDRDPNPDGYWNEDCHQSTDCALPTSSVDAVQVEDRGHQMMYSDDQRRIVGRRWEDTSDNAIQMSDGSASRDHETDQSAAEQDTLPRRGHMKTLLAQWRQLEQRRKEEKLIERAAAIHSDRSRRTAVRTAWFKASDTEQQRGFDGTRSQSCGPVSRRSTEVHEELDNSSRRRNGSVDDEGETEMTFDRLAIKEKFERLDAEAQRTAILNRKKVIGRQRFRFYFVYSSLDQKYLRHVHVTITFHTNKLLLLLLIFIILSLFRGRK